MAFLAPLMLFFFSARPCASAKEKEEPILRPPSPQPVVVSAYVGERTAIDLTLRGRIEDPATILIRKKPRFGLLSDPERVHRQIWRVWYSVPPDSAENLDSFTYAAKSVDSPVSVAASVQVSIIKRAAQLVFSIFTSLANLITDGIVFSHLLRGDLKVSNEAYTAAYATLLCFAVVATVRGTDQ